MMPPAPTFREALRMQKPPAWRLVVGKVWPLFDVCAWLAREAMLDEIAADLVDRGPSQTVDFLVHLREVTGSDCWLRVLAELQERWARGPRRPGTNPPPHGQMPPAPPPPPPPGRIVHDHIPPKENP